ASTFSSTLAGVASVSKLASTPAAAPARRRSLRVKEPATPQTSYPRAGASNDVVDRPDPLDPQREQRGCQRAHSPTIGLESVPRRSISTSTVSPTRRKRPRAAPTPAGV